jgi:hypothetical protein
MSRNRVALVLSLIVLVMLALAVMPAAVAAPACDVEAKVPSSARIFAKTNIVSDWREYSSLAQAPSVVLDSGISAELWQDRSKDQSALIVEPGQDFTMYTRYCFNGQGRLASVGLEIRTPLGWGHRAQGYISGVDFIETSSEFFNLKNGKALPMPLGVVKVPRALQPVLYLKQSELPFASLLAAAGKTKKHSGGIEPLPTQSIVETDGTPSGN